MPPRHHPARDPLNERIRQERIEWARSLPVGRFEGRVGAFYWIAPDQFSYVPDQALPFAFIRANGERIAPREFTTDLGTVAALASIASSCGYVSRTSHAPAWLPHDWDFEQHHKGVSVKSFEEANLTLAEAIKTMQEAGLCRRSLHDIINVYQAVMSPIARAMWGGKDHRSQQRKSAAPA